MYQQTQADAGRARLISRPVILFFTLAFAISWGLVALVTLPAGYPGSPDAVDALFGLAFAGMLVGPVLAAFIVASLENGRAGRAAIFTSLTVWRVAPVYYLVAVLLVPAVLALVLVAFSIANPVYAPGGFGPGGGAMLILGGYAAGLVAGSIEEIGWSGFALRKLLVTRSVLFAGLLVGVLHGLWHLAAGYWGEGGLYGGLFPAYFAIAWIGGLTGLRLIIAFLVRRTGSTLLAQLAHASYTGSLFAFWPSATSPLENIYWTAAFATLLLLVGVILATRPLPSVST